MSICGITSDSLSIANEALNKKAQEVLDGPLKPHPTSPTTSFSHKTLTTLLVLITFSLTDNFKVKKKKHMSHQPQTQRRSPTSLDNDQPTSHAWRSKTPHVEDTIMVMTLRFYVPYALSKYFSSFFR